MSRSLLSCFILTLFLAAGCAEQAKETTPTDAPAAADEASIPTTAPEADASETATTEAPSETEQQTDAAAGEPKTRKFDFHYDVAISDLAPGAKARVWVPIAQSNAFQDVELKEIKVPAEYEETTEKRYGNKFIYFEATANNDGEIPVSIAYTIERHEVTPANATAVEEGAEERFLVSTTMVPVDGSLTKKVFGDSVPEGDAMAKARQMYNAVETRMEYGKPADKAWGRGDAHFACDEKVGNCTDFHSLFIALSRDQGMPAKFEMGFSIPTDGTEGEVGGYHCWAFFANGKKWLPVDISEADKHPEMKEYYFTRLTPDRVNFTQGRDLQLQPSPAAEEINFAIYPYAEVDGRPHENVRKAFRFKDIQ